MHNINLRVVVFGLFLIIAFAPITYSQKSRSRKLSDEQSVHEFADSFIRILDSTQDLRKVPKRFFIVDFDKRFNKSRNFTGGEEGFENLTEEEKLQQSLLSVNYWYLLYCFARGSEVDKADESENIYPKRILKVIKSSKYLKSILIEGSEVQELKDVHDLRAFFKDATLLVNALRNEISRKSRKWKDRYKRSFREENQRRGLFRSKICSGNDCKEFPDETKIFTVTRFPLSLSIIVINSEFKIFDIFPLAD